MKQPEEKDRSTEAGGMAQPLGALAALAVDRPQFSSQHPHEVARNHVQLQLQGSNADFRPGEHLPTHTQMKIFFKRAIAQTKLSMEIKTS